MLSKMDEFGSPSSYNHYAVGWAWAMNTPFQWTKQVASHWGGTRNGTIVHWPDGHRRSRAGCARSSPTSSTSPRRSSRPPVCPSRRWSTACSSRRWRARACSTRSTSPTTPERHDLQYFEMFGNRGIYHQGWSAVTKHRTPWVMVGGDAAGVRRRRLGALRRQPATTARPTTSPPSSPSMLAKLQRLWLIEATKYNVLPIDDRGAERLEPGDRPAGRRSSTATRSCSSPAWAGCRRTASSASRTSRSPSPPRSTCPTAAPNGVIIAQGGRFGGWAVYAKDGSAKFVYNVLGIQEFATEADDADPRRHAPGAHGVRLRRRRPGQGRRRHPLLRRHAGRHRPGRSHPADDLLRRRDHRHRLRVRHHRHRRLHRRRPAGSPARSTGSRSTSATTTTTTSSTPTNASASPWRGSRGDLLRRHDVCRWTPLGRDDQLKECPDVQNTRAVTQPGGSDHQRPPRDREARSRRLVRQGCRLSRRGSAGTLRGREGVRVGLCIVCDEPGGQPDRCAEDHRPRVGRSVA